MLPDGRRLGAHLPLGTGMVKAADRAHEIGATTLQVFGDNPTAWKRRTELPPELPAFRDRLAEHGIEPLVVHAAYLINLAGPDPTFHERSVGVLVHELVQARAYGAGFVNVHTGSHRGTTPEDGLDRLAAAVVRVLGEAGAGPGAARLVLENSAGSGWAVGTTLEELAWVADAIDAAGVARDRVGFCLDTAHLWAGGHAIGDPDGVDRLIDRFDELIGLDRLVLVHLYASKSECGSRLDRHEHLGAGRIGAPALQRILTHPDLAHVTYELETPGMDVGYDAVNIARAEAIARGEPLEPLPPEAFEVGSGRSSGPGHARVAAEPSAG